MLAALLAVVQAGLLTALVLAQRGSAHVIDTSGWQRTRSQQVAYLALAAHTGHAPADWRAQMDATIAAILAVRREMGRDAMLFSGPRGSDGKTPLERLSDPYIAAARAIERDPSDAAAFAYVRDHRSAMLAAYDAVVKARVARLAQRNDLLVAAIAFGVVAKFALFAISWYGFTAPAERRVRVLLAEVTEQREQMQSLFQQNPDGVAVYDRDGFLVRANRARASLGGHGERDAVGRHYTSFVAPQLRRRIREAFERAGRGESVVLDNVLQTPGGELVDVETTLFPNLVGGKPAGVIAVSKDVRALRLAQRLYAEQSRRLGDLYAIAAAHGKGTLERSRDAIAIAAQHLGYEWAAVAEIVDGRSKVVATYGQPDGVTVGAERRLAGTLAGHVAASRDVWSIDDLPASQWQHEVPPGAHWGSVAGMPIEADGFLYGVFGLAARGVRSSPLTEADRHFLRLVAALLGSIIERDRRERKLDSLAFFDALTGLPNRVLFLDRLDELINAAERRNARFALHFVDLDRFKEINDRHGHRRGDEVLRLTAHRLRSCVRDTDTVARLSGDEFVVLQTDADGARELAERVVAAMASPFVVEGSIHTLGASVGTAFYPNDGDSATAVLSAADAALYVAKRTGRNRFAFARAPGTDGVDGAA